MGKWCRLLLLVSLLFAGTRAQAEAAASLPTNAPPRLALRDQYDAPQALTFPAARVTLLTIADRRSAEEVAEWVTALKPAFEGRVDIRGLADVRGVPGLLKGRVRHGFQERFTYPVMLDWTGAACDQLGFRSGTVNVLVIDRRGKICARAYGRASTGRLELVRAALDGALAQTK